jgi:hypothetical protein
MRREKNKSHKWIANIGISVLSIFFCLILVEAALRVFKPFYFTLPVEAYEYDEDLAYRLRAASHSFFFTNYQQEIRTNQSGTINFQEDLSKYETIVFALGDSYTQGIGVGVDSSYPFQLDLLLNLDDKGNYSKKYGVVNLALGPYGSKQQLIALKRFAKSLRKPNIVLYLGCSNDYSDDLLFEAGIRHKNIVVNNPRYGWLYYPMKWVFIDTEIGKRMKNLMQEGILRAETSKIANEDSQGLSNAEMVKNGIEKIVETARELGAIPILSWFTVGDSYDWLKSWTAQNDIQFADWGPGAMSISGAIPKLPWDNAHSGGHHRAWLNFVIAKSFAKEIQNIQTFSK